MIAGVIAGQRCGQDMFRFFSTPLPDDSPVDPDSAAIVARIAHEIPLVDTRAGSVGFGPYLSPRTNLYKVGAGAPRKGVASDYDTSADTIRPPQTMQAKLGVPIPPGAKELLPGTDESMTIYQPSEDYLFDGLHMRNEVWNMNVFSLAEFGGGSLAAGTYFVYMTATSDAGETARSPVKSITLTGSGKLIRINFWPRHFSNTIRVFVGTTAGNAVLRAILTPASHPTLWSINTFFTSFDYTGALVGGADGTTTTPTVNTADVGPNDWRCGPSGTMYAASTSPGNFRTVSSGPAAPQQFAWGATASHIPGMAGAISKRDFLRVEIDHVIVANMRNTNVAGTGKPADTTAGSLNGASWLSANRYAHPAQSQDGWCEDTIVPAGAPPGSKPLPEGARLRLKPISRGGPVITPAGYTVGGVLTAFTGIASVKRFAYMLCKCLQNFGMVVPDGTTGMFIHCRSASADGAGTMGVAESGWRPGTPDTLWGSTPDDPFDLSAETDAINQVPWDLLEVVRMGWTPDLPVDYPATPCTNKNAYCPVGGQ